MTKKELIDEIIAEIEDFYDEEFETLPEWDAIRITLNTVEGIMKSKKYYQNTIIK